MIRIKDHKQGYLLDPWDYVGPKRKSRMEDSWAGFFRQYILDKLPVDKLAAVFTEGIGRPTKELHSILGILFLQQMNDLTDEETVDQAAFNLQWHYALNITEETDEAKYISPKTLWSMRKLVTDLRLDEQMFTGLTDATAKIFKVDASRQRLDSVHIMSNMRHLGRIGIFTSAIHKFLVNLKRQRPVIYSQLEQKETQLIERYLTEKAVGCFALVKPSESEKTLSEVSRDLFTLVNEFNQNEEVSCLPSYHLLVRVLNEQCTIESEESESPIATPKSNKEISCESLQNPSDPDSTYDGHKGQGYQIQLMETFCDSKDSEIREKTLNLITHVHLEKASAHDSKAVLPVLEEAQNRNILPQQLLADSLYGCDENVEKSSELTVEIISPAMGRSQKQGELHLSDFQISPEGKIIACPAGQAPLKTIKNNKHKEKRYSTAFSSEQCCLCPNREICPVKTGRKHHYLRYSQKALRLAMRRAREASAEFIDKYRWRSGIEATFSEMDRKTGIKQLRVRGFKAVRFCMFLKALAINVLRASRIAKACKHAFAPKGSLLERILQTYFIIKELLVTFFSWPPTYIPRLS